MTENNSLQVCEHFYSIQGEGFYTGVPAYFIRLAGCHIHCDFCDSRNSWDSSSAKEFISKDLIEIVKKAGAKTVVVSGGEPMLHSLDAFCKDFHEQGIRLHLESSGGPMYSGNWDWICISPKENFPPIPLFYEMANELKCLIGNENDFAIAEEHAHKINPNAVLLLQAQWDQRQEMLPIIIQYIKDNPQWRLSLQSHKYINIR